MILNRADGGESLLTRTKHLLRERGLHARKGLAQHFLVDGSILNLVLRAAEVTKDDVVVEVGPGLGVLTGELAERAGWLVAVELDRDMVEVLRETLSGFKNISLINADILKTDPATLLKNQPDGLPADLKTGKYKVVANLPYYITSAVLRHFLEASVKPESIVLMIQREVAKAVTAKPGDMSLLSVSVQLYGEPSIAGKVPARSFYPPPDVESAILKIKVYPEPAIQISNIEGFFNLVRAGFSQARKQIINPLSHGLDLPKPEAAALLERAGISQQRRAETLSIEEWGRLWKVYMGEE